MGIVSKPFTLAAGGTILAAELNDCFDDIYAEFNGNIDNTNIKAGANIDGGKLLGSSITSSQLANNAVTDAKLDYNSVKVVRALATGVKMARGSKAFTLAAGQATVTITFSTDSDDGNPSFGAAPRLTGLVLMTTGTNVYRAKLTAISTTSATFHINSDSGADVQSGNFLWIALGT